MRPAGADEGIDATAVHAEAGAGVVTEPPTGDRVADDAVVEARLAGRGAGGEQDLGGDRRRLVPARELEALVAFAQRAPAAGAQLAGPRGREPVAVLVALRELVAERVSASSDGPAVSGAVRLGSVWVESQIVEGEPRSTVKPIFGMRESTARRWMLS